MFAGIRATAATLCLDLGLGLGLGLALGCAPAAAPLLPDPDPTGEDDGRLLLLPPLAPCDPRAAAPARVRVASWNIGATRRSSIDAVNEVVADVDADVLIIQEIEIGAHRTDEIDQPRAIAEANGYEFAFAAALTFDGGEFGMAVFSRLPFAAADRIWLDSSDAYEPRIVLDTTICAGPTPWRVVDVHADFMEAANVRNLTEIAGLVGAVGDLPTLVAGDFNATPDTEGVQTLFDVTGLVDVFGPRDPGPTRNGKRIDFVLASAGLDASVQAVERRETPASDHRLLRVDF